MKVETRTKPKKATKIAEKKQKNKHKRNQKQSKSKTEQEKLRKQQKRAKHTVTLLNFCEIMSKNRLDNNETNGNPSKTTVTTFSLSR